MTSSIYTKTGDQGETGLLGGERVPKDNVRVEAFGAVDELAAAIGHARSFHPEARLDRVLARIQPLLFELGTELAAVPKNDRPHASVRTDDVINLEKDIDVLDADMPALGSFILPTGTPTATALHMARVICRRAERRVVTLRRAEPETPAETIVFLNRLADLLFVMARWANWRAGMPETPWKART